MSDRAVIYVSGQNEAEVQEQLRQCQELCGERDHTIVAVARETPGQTTAWEDAHRMVRDGEVDRIVIASGAAVPDMLESATGGLHASGDRQRPGQHRTRPVPRGEGA